MYLARPCFPEKDKREREKHSESLLNEAELKTPFISAGCLLSLYFIYQKIKKKYTPYMYIRFSLCFFARNRKQASGMVWVFGLTWQYYYCYNRVCNFSILFPAFYITRHATFYVYSNNDDMTVHSILTLTNNFTCTVIVKKYTLASKTDK